MTTIHHVEKRADGTPRLFYCDRPRPESWRRHPWGYAPGGMTPRAGQAATTREGDPITWAQAFAAGGLDFTVEARDLFTVRAMADANGKRALKVPMAVGLVRKEDEVVVGYQSDTRALIQPAEIRACFEASGLSPDSCAVLDGGSRCYAQALDTVDQVRADDTGKVATFLTFFWGFGSETGAVIPGKTREGIVCTNTYDKARASVSGFDRIAHRGDASRKVAALAKRLETEAAEQRAWLDTARRLAETKHGVGQGRSQTVEFLTTAMGSDTSRAVNVAREVAGILRTADKRTGVIGDGSLWDLFQAASYYTSHERTVRNADGASAEVARRLSDTPDWLGATFEALATIASDAAPVTVTVTR